MSANILQNLVTKYKRPLIISATLVLTIAMYFVQQLGNHFEASVLTKQDEASIAFDGTVYPIAYVPNWSEWSGDIRKTPYSEIPSNQLIPMPRYDLNELRTEVASTSSISGEQLKKIRNAQLTYSVLFTGNYELDYKTGVGSHPAHDIRAPQGTPALAIANGIVEKAVEDNSGFGYHIVVKHVKVPKYDTLYSSYSHLSKVLVKEGDIVRKGQKIGETGQTGTATTPHLHFQIDKSSAPWHPYWPFGFAEIASAGLSFFEAINVGFNIQNVYSYTIDPILFVQENLNGATSAPVSTNNNTTSNPTPTINTETITPPSVVVIDHDAVAPVYTPPATAEVPTLTSFYIESNKSLLQVGEEAKLIIEARDQKNQVISNYTRSSNFGFGTIPAGYLSLLDSLQFNNGRAELRYQINSIGTYSIQIIDGDVRAITNIEVVDAANASNGVQFTLTGETNIKPGTSTLIVVQAMDQNGQHIHDFTPRETIPVKLASGEGILNKVSLTSVDFYDGTASFYVSSIMEGTIVVKVGSSSISINVTNDAVIAASFLIKHDGSFTLGEAEKIQISIVDSAGNTVPNYHFSGSIQLTLPQGYGTFTPEKLVDSHFVNGSAELTFVSNMSDPVIIQAVLSNLFGKSEKLVAAEKTSTADAGIFKDIASNHPNYIAIKYLQEQGIIGGYADGSFRPDQAVNRAEALKMLLLSEKINVSESPAPFSDVERGTWYAPYVQTAYKQKIAGGYADGTFRPQSLVNKAEFLKLALETHGFEPEFVDEAPYNDVAASDWFAIYAQYAKEANLIQTFNNVLNGDKPMNRAEVAEMMYRLRVLEISGAKSFSSDLRI